MASVYKVSAGSGGSMLGLLAPASNANQSGNVLWQEMFGTSESLSIKSDKSLSKMLSQDLLEGNKSTLKSKSTFKSMSSLLSDNPESGFLVSDGEQLRSMTAGDHGLLKSIAGAHGDKSEYSGEQPAADVDNDQENPEEQNNDENNDALTASNASSMIPAPLPPATNYNASYLAAQQKQWAIVKDVQSRELVDADRKQAEPEKRIPLRSCGGVILILNGYWK
eukprot:g7178.t1